MADETEIDATSGARKTRDRLAWAVLILVPGAPVLFVVGTLWLAPLIIG